MLQVKSIKVDAKVTTVKFHTEDVESSRQTVALYALAGGYNQVARGVDLDKFCELEAKFEQIVQELADLEINYPKER